MQFLPDNSGDGSENEKNDENDSDDNSDSHSARRSGFLGFVGIDFLFILRGVNNRCERLVFQIEVVPEIIDENGKVNNLE